MPQYISELKLPEQLETYEVKDKLAKKVYHESNMDTIGLSANSSIADILLALPSYACIFLSIDSTTAYGVEIRQEISQAFPSHSSVVGTLEINSISPASVLFRMYTDGSNLMYLRKYDSDLARFTSWQFIDYFTTSNLRVITP